MDEFQFFLLLPSNASLNIYKDNTLSSYTVHLPEPIVLEGDYEVGLQSILWPKTFDNITESSKRIFYSIPSGLTDAINITKGNYTSASDLILNINSTLKTVSSKNIQIKYNPISEKVSIIVQSGYKLFLPEKISHILGSGGEPVTITKSQESPFVVDLSGGLQCLYVYADIVSHQIVGDTKARFLKVLPVEGKHGDTIYRTFDTPTYYPVGTKQFQDIKVDIRDDSGNKVHFMRGRIVVNLHFRRKSYLP